MNNRVSNSSGKIHRVLLNKDAAADIYEYKLALITPTSFKSCVEKYEKKIKGQSAKLAKTYGVSAKTIRDIWNKKSWTNATCHLWEREWPFTIAGSSNSVSQHMTY
jgi:hypothetical protein